jgi:uncharacterized membrane protein YraQ (UPF0718 family)
MPFVLLGILLSVVVQVWLPQGALIKSLPKNPLLRRLLVSTLGVLLPVCECGNVPLTRGLLKQGLSVSESITFLLAAPIVNPITILTTFQAFGGDKHIVFSRIVGGFLIANIVGWIYSKKSSSAKVVTDQFRASCEVVKSEDAHNHGKISKSTDLFRTEMTSIMPALVVGALVAGIVQIAIPRSALYSIGANPVISIAVMMLLAFIVSICSNVDAFFALAFSRTFTAGSVVSFLVFGPIIDIKMLTLMKTTFTTRTLVEMTLLVGTMSMILGLGVNYVF